MTDITEVDILVGLAVNGIFTGIGVTIGSYIANNHLIESIKKLINKKK